MKDGLSAVMASAWGIVLNCVVFSKLPTPAVFISASSDSSKRSITEGMVSFFRFGRSVDIIPLAASETERNASLPVVSSTVGESPSRLLSFSVFFSGEVSVSREMPYCAATSFFRSETT